MKELSSHNEYQEPSFEMLAISDDRLLSGSYDVNFPDPEDGGVL